MGKDDTKIDFGHEIVKIVQQGAEIEEKHGLRAIYPE